jgi:hypothetical protein
MSGDNENGSAEKINFKIKIKKPKNQPVGLINFQNCLK